MQESLLQFIWEHGYFNQQDLQLVNGEPLEILYPGNRNTNQGPDFEMARVRIGDTLMAGNIELHVETAHWYQHRHEDDPRYKNLLLHVVWKHRAPAPGNIPVLELESRVPLALWKTYALWMNQPNQLPCSGFLSGFPFESLAQWFRELSIQRLEEKADRWLTELQDLQGHWEALCWHKLCRNFGHHVNADAFEAVARSIPLNLLARHKPQVIQLESLLLGQAGLLQGDYGDPYPKMLQKEYRFLAMKYGLCQPKVRMEFLRMRPANFPGLRLAQLAMLLHERNSMFRHFIEASSIQEVFSMFDLEANDYWHYHYHFNRSSAYAPKSLGVTTIRNILVNTVIPLRYTYGKRMGNKALQESAIRWLESLPAEADSHTSIFRKEGFPIRHAADLQMLHHLKARFCDQKNCLQCAIGKGLLAG